MDASGHQDGHQLADGVPQQHQGGENEGLHPLGEHDQQLLLQQQHQEAQEYMQHQHLHHQMQQQQQLFDQQQYLMQHHMQLHDGGQQQDGHVGQPGQPQHDMMQQQQQDETSHQQLLYHQQQHLPMQQHQPPGQHEEHHHPPAQGSEAGAEHHHHQPQQQQQQQQEHQAAQHQHQIPLQPLMGVAPPGGPGAPRQLPPMPSRPGPSSQMFQIFDRRINFNLLPQNASLYSMLRAWVQDDPFRQHASTKSRSLEEVMQMPLPRPAPETATTLLRLGPQSRKSTIARKSDTLNTLTGVPPATLLELHVTYMQQVRRGLHKTRARRYQRFKSRISALGIPPCVHLEKALMADDASVGGGGDGKSVASVGGGGMGDDASLSAPHMSV